MSNAALKPHNSQELFTIYKAGRQIGVHEDTFHGLKVLADAVAQRSRDIERERIRNIDLDKLADAIFGEDRSPMQWHHEVAQDVIKVLFEEEPSILPIDPHVIEARRASYKPSVEPEVLTSATKVELPPDSNPMHRMGYGRNDD